MKLFLRIADFGSRFSVISLGITLIFTLFSAPAHAIETDEQVWLQHFWVGPSTWKVRPYMETQARMGSGAEKLEQVLIRPAIGYQLTDQSSVWFGLGWTPTFIPRYNRETRYWQQYLLSFKIDALPSWNFTSRTRLEQRSVDGASLIGWRIREFLRATLPFPGVSDPAWQLTFWDELFWNLSDLSAAVPAGFNQNRIFLGPFVKLHSNVTLEAGYLSVLTNRPLTQNRLVHGLLIGLHTSL